MSTPEQKFRERWRATLPQGAFLQLIESRTTGVPDAYLVLPFVCQYPYNAAPIVVREKRCVWLEFKVPPYKVDNIQINWHIRHVRAGGSSGIVAPLPVQKAPKNSPNLCPTAPLDRPQCHLSTPANTKAPANKLKPSEGLKNASAMPEIGYWPMDGWPPEEIERINEYIKSGARGSRWLDWLAEVTNTP